MDEDVLIEDVDESEYFDTSKAGFFADCKAYICSTASINLS